MGLNPLQEHAATPTQPVGVMVLSPAGHSTGATRCLAQLSARQLTHPSEEDLSDADEQSSQLSSSYTKRSLTLPTPLATSATSDSYLGAECACAVLTRNDCPCRLVISRTKDGYDDEDIYETVDIVRSHTVMSSTSIATIQSGLPRVARSACLTCLAEPGPDAKAQDGATITRTPSSAALALPASSANAPAAAAKAVVRWSLMASRRLIGGAEAAVVAARGRGGGRHHGQHEREGHWLPGRYI